MLYKVTGYYYIRKCGMLSWQQKARFLLQTLHTGNNNSLDIEHCLELINMEATGFYVDLPEPYKTLKTYIRM